MKRERLSANIKLTLHKALILSVMTYACPALELAADAYVLKLQRLQKKKRFSAPLEIVQVARWSSICIQLSTFRMYTIT
jgi:hypothetical protein